MTTFLKRDEFSILVQANQFNRHSAVISAATELFVNNGNPSRDDLLHFEELCLRFLPKLDLRTKVEISERLSTCPHLPKAVAMSLAREDISVAAAMLHHHYGFTDEDLLVILSNGNQLHALAISSRKRLSDKVIIALSQFELPDFKHDELKEISVTKLDENNEEPAMPLKIGGSAALLLEPDYHQASQNDEFTIGLDAFLANEHAYVLTQMQYLEDSIQNNAFNPATLLQEAYNRAEHAVDFLRLARKKDAAGFANLLSMQCSLSKADAKQIIDDAEGFALAVCLKSLALPGHVANEAFILLNPELGTNADQIFLLEWFYGQISPPAARSLVDNWSNHKSDSHNTSSRNHQSVYAGKTLAQSQPDRITRRASRTDWQSSNKQSTAR